MGRRGDGAEVAATGLGVAAAALVARQGVTLWAARAAAPAAARKFYEGGFEGTMTRREAALILVRAPRQREEGGGDAVPRRGRPARAPGPGPCDPPELPAPHALPQPPPPPLP